MSKLHRVAWDERAGAAVNARRELPQLAASYFARSAPCSPTIHPHPSCTASGFSPSACATPSSCSARATARAWRHALAPCIEFNSRWERSNDSAAAGRLVSKSMSAASPQRARILHFLEERAAAKAEEFRKDWSESSMPRPGALVDHLLGAPRADARRRP